MNSSDLIKTACTALLFGPLSHYAFWMRYQFDNSSHVVALAALAFLPCATALLLQYRIPLKDAIVLSIISEWCYLFSTFASIIAYRLFLHPLRKFQGPTWAKLTTFWRMKAMTDNGDRGYITLHELHQKYGEVIRVGPRVLSINHVDTLQALYGSGSECIRLPQWEAGRKQLQSLSNKDEHRARRRVWEQGLNAKVCQEYLPRMNQIVETLLAQLHRLNSKSVNSPIDMNKPIRYFVYDIISAIGFGHSYRQLESLEPFPAIAKVEKFMRGAVLFQVFWLLNILQKIPGIEDPQTELRDWALDVLNERDKEAEKRKKGELSEDKQKDVMDFVYHEEEKVRIKGTDKRWTLSKEDIAEDAVTLQIAGSDTSYSLILNLLFYLSKYPEVQSQVRTEVSSSINSIPDQESNLPTWSVLNASPILDAIIQETLRLHPPVPQGMPRLNPTSHAMIVAGHTIPPDTIISAPTYSIQRNQRYWLRPDEWIPSRWIAGTKENKELVLDKDAFAPFSLGPMNCVGRYFAIMEVKVLIARLLLDFELLPELADSAVDARDWKKDQEKKDEAWLEGAKDYFTLSPPILKLQLRSLSQ